ncbi:hypothetical protein, partial [Bythopirellula polymerisocia]|uniref:hypothetical protein n=1 Tax=Bythopirellula polymerisocia TaxID=2528003 RepID=UPI001E537CB3
EDVERRPRSNRDLSGKVCYNPHNYLALYFSTAKRRTFQTLFTPVALHAAFLLEVPNRGTWAGQPLVEGGRSIKPR